MLPAVVGVAAIGALLVLAFLKSSPPQTAPNPGAPSSQGPSESADNAQTEAILNKVKDSQQAASNSQETSNEPSPESEQTFDERFDNARKIGSESKRTQMLVELAKELAIKSPEKAKEFAQDILAGPASQHGMLDSFLSTFVDEYSKKDPRAAIDWALFLPGETRLEAYQKAVNNWLRTDTQGVVDLIGSLNDHHTRSDLIGIAFGHLESINPNDAAYWVENLAQFPESQPHVNAIGKIWSRSDIQSAHAWASTITEPSARVDAFNGITETLMQSSPAIAEKWIEQFPTDHDIQHHSRYMLNHAMGGGFDSGPVATPPEGAPVEP